MQLENAEAARQLDLAARWADLHPPESIHSAAAFTVPGTDHEEPLAGEGCPLVAEFCIAELGTVLGISSTSAKKLIGHALELRHRLPRLWSQVQSGRVPAWRARTVAEATIHSTPSLTREAARLRGRPGRGRAGGSDPRSSTGSSRRPSSATTSRLRTRPLTRRTATSRSTRATRPSHDEDVHFAGTMRFEAELDIADALDLNHALTQQAAEQKALGSTESLDVRRAKALGDLARTQTALDLLADAGRAGPAPGGRVAGEERAGTSRPTSRPPVRSSSTPTSTPPLPTAAGEQTVFGPTGRMEERQRLILLDQLKSWCGDSRTKITVKPVIDLNAHLTAPGYDIPDRIRDQVILRDRTCVFPWCTRPARGCDIDHVIPYDHDAAAEGRPQPGPTHADNLAALCRFHHRLKTHTAWRYRVTGPGCFEWTSPHGHHYRRDRTGTTSIDGADPDPPGIPRPRRR